MNTADILASVKELGLGLEWHSYRAVPNAHSFATYDIPNKTFDGADEMAFMRHYPLNVTFFYRDTKTAKDFENEKIFESAVRPMGNFTSVSDYDSSNGLFFTQYTFNMNENMEE